MPSAAAHRPTRIVNHSTRHLYVLHCTRITSSSPLTAFSASTLCTDTTKTFPLVFPTWSWWNHVQPLTAHYKMPNISTGRQGDEKLKFWSHRHCSRNAPPPSSTPIHFTPGVTLIKLTFHLNAVVLQNKRNGLQLHWKIQISNFIDQTLTGSQVFSRNQLIPVTMCLPWWGTLRDATATDGF